MLTWKGLVIGKTQVLTPNDFVGTITGLSPIKTMSGGLQNGRGKVKVSYQTGSGMAEGWFQLRNLRKYEVVLKKKVNVVQPPAEGEEPWLDQSPIEETVPVEVGETVVEIVPITDAIDKVEGEDNESVDES